MREKGRRDGGEEGRRGEGERRERGWEGEGQRGQSGSQRETYGGKRETEKCRGERMEGRDRMKGGGRCNARRCTYGCQLFHNIV
jgi:hypothetical protein